MIYAFKDAGDGYYQVELSEGEALPMWAESLTPCDVQAPPPSAPLPEPTKAELMQQITALLQKVESLP